MMWLYVGWRWAGAAGVGSLDLLSMSSHFVHGFIYSPQQFPVLVVSYIYLEKTSSKRGHGPAIPMKKVLDSSQRVQSSIAVIS